MLVEQLLPAPVRYRLVWHDKGALTRPLYLWRPVPPSAQSVALGMLAASNLTPYLPHASPMPPLHLAYISPRSPLYLP